MNEENVAYIWALQFIRTGLHQVTSEFDQGRLQCSNMDWSTCLWCLYLSANETGRGVSTVCQSFTQQENLNLWKCSDSYQGVKSFHQTQSESLPGVRGVSLQGLQGRHNQN